MSLRNYYHYYLFVLKAEGSLREGNFFIISGHFLGPYRRYGCVILLCLDPGALEFAMRELN